MANKHLIIVESPSKIKTLKKFLGNEYQIEASVGHIRDLPKSNLGIDLDNNFSPTYVVSDESKKVVKQLKSVLKSIDTIYIATDPDREGEAIAWHLIDELKPKGAIKRMVFNEITKTAIKDALNNVREININLVNAQECRRFLDRLFGFLVSKQLWYNVKSGLSAGRVQSPALKILVDREKLRAKFIESEYWSLEGNFKSNSGNIFSKLISIKNKKIAIGNSFNKMTGELESDNTIVLNKESAEKLVNSIQSNNWEVSDLSTKPQTQNPYPPFITSTLQQEGIRKLKMSANRVMRVAQGLYENGYITYMRTDSINLSQEALNAARKVITTKYGADYLPKSPRVYKSKTKNAQEAHEAIRPAGSSFHDPKTLATKISSDEYRLYDLIWKRTVASQMNSAKTEQTKLYISDTEHIFSASGKTIVFPGFLRAYVEGSDDPAAQLDDMEKTLPIVKVGDKVKWLDINPKQHFTKPASRYTEASLVKELEALGIGRPSTYAAIMKKIQDKGYVNKSKGALIPTFTGYAIVQFLEKYYQDLVNLQYTSQMEDDLDKISLGDITKEEYLKKFYFNTNGHIGLKDQLEQEYDKNQSRLIQTIKNKGSSIDIRIGRYGLYAEIDESRVTLDSNTIPSEISSIQIQKLLSDKNAAPTEFGKDEKTGETILLKKGRFGPYLQLGKKMKSLPPGISEDNLTDKIAADIISLPSEIGKDTTNNAPIIKDIGKYGPYLKCGKKTKTISSPDDILTLTLERANEIINTATTDILKELSEDVVIKNGRYGIYVTNGKVNVTIPKSLNYEELDLATALDMISKKKPRKKFFKRK